jgi:hypothetical protein
MHFISRLKFCGLLFLLLAGPFGCATPSGSNGPGNDELQMAPGTSAENVLRAAAAAGKQMNYAGTREGNRLILSKRLPFGAGNIVGDPAKHQNRITVSAVPEAAGAPLGVRVEGEYLGDLRNKDLFNCLSCDVNEIKKAIRGAR